MESIAESECCKRLLKTIKQSTLKDVARAAGVSAASVSRAMAGKGAVSGELHARIMAAAARLDYKPNLAARALASRHSGLLAIVVSSMDDGVVARTAAAALRALARRSYGMLLVSETVTERVDMAGLATRGVEALLFVGRPPVDDEREALSAHELAWVAVADVEAGDAACLDLGRFRAVELAGLYLQQVGHRSLGLIAPAELAVGELVGRLEQEGTAIRLARQLPDDPVAVRSALSVWLEAADRPSAIVCADDVTALVVIRECGARGISVPEDLAVVGFGDEPFARFARPALTTVRPACALVGAHAAEAVLEVLAGRSCPRYTPVNKLVVRESSERP